FLGRTGEVVSLLRPEPLPADVENVLIAGIARAKLALELGDGQLEDARLERFARGRRCFGTTASQLGAENVPSTIVGDLESLRILLHALDDVTQGCSGAERLADDLHRCLGGVAILRLLLLEHGRDCFKDELTD